MVESITELPALIGKERTSVGFARATEDYGVHTRLLLS